MGDSMTKIKMCGLKRPCDIVAANDIRPDYIGFIFAKKSKRYVSPETALELRNLLHSDIKAVGVFVNEEPETVADFLRRGIIDVAQLHGSEDAAYVQTLRQLTDKPVCQAFRIDGSDDVQRAQESPADMILVDSGAGGTGEVFDWNLLSGLQRPFFLAGGLNCDNISEALKRIQPYGVDVSSGIETDGLKDENKMHLFASKVRDI